MTLSLKMLKSLLIEINEGISDFYLPNFLFELSIKFNRLQRSPIRILIYEDFMLNDLAELHQQVLVLESNQPLLKMAYYYYDGFVKPSDSFGDKKIKDAHAELGLLSVLKTDREQSYYPRGGVQRGVEVHLPQIAAQFWEENLHHSVQEVKIEIQSGKIVVENLAHLETQNAQEQKEGSLGSLFHNKEHASDVVLTLTVLDAIVEVDRGCGQDGLQALLRKVQVVVERAFHIDFYYFE